LITRTSAIVVVLLAFVGGGVATSWLYFGTYRHERPLTSEMRDILIKSASDGTLAVLSYKPDTMDSDFAGAKTHLTGNFLQYYENFTTQVVGPAVKQRGVRTKAAVIQAAVSELKADSATVLIFVNQWTSSPHNPEPSMSSSSVNVGLQQVRGNWLISSFDPV